MALRSPSPIAAAAFRFASLAIEGIRIIIIVAVSVVVSISHVSIGVQLALSHHELVQTTLQLTLLSLAITRWSLLVLLLLPPLLLLLLVLMVPLRPLSRPVGSLPLSRPPAASLGASLAHHCRRPAQIHRAAEYLNGGRSVSPPAFFVPTLCDALQANATSCRIRWHAKRTQKVSHRISVLVLCSVQLPVSTAILLADDTAKVRRQVLHCGRCPLRLLLRCCRRTSWLGLRLRLGLGLRCPLAYCSFGVFLRQLLAGGLRLGLRLGLGHQIARCCCGHCCRFANSCAVCNPWRLLLLSGRLSRRCVGTACIGIRRCYRSDSNGRGSIGAPVHRPICKWRARCLG